MAKVRTVWLKAGALSITLASCHPFGCGSSQCVKDHEYGGAKHCMTVLEASLVIVRGAHLPAGAEFDPGTIQSELIGGMNNTLAAGARRGMSRDAVYKDLERSKNAYVQAYAASKVDPHQKLVNLFNDVNGCLPHSEPNS